MAERIFPKINTSWKDEKTRFLKDTLKAIIIVKKYFKNYCCICIK